jgi:serine/threonine-protein kinase
MSEVWAATDAAGRTVALKVLLQHARDNPEIVARFRREAELLRRIDSAHVPRLYEFLEREYILIEEFVEGRLLTHLLDERTFSVENAIALGVGIARALVEVHRAGIVHRDLKPGNIILHPQGRAVLIDLGLSRLTLQDDALTEITDAERAIGTIAYMAPEQFVAPVRITEAVDLYALGAILFRAIAGRHVFGQRTNIETVCAKLGCEAPALEMQRKDSVAQALAGMVARLLRRDPESRYASAGELLADLLLLAQGVIPREPEPADVVLDEPRRRWPGASVTLALIAGLGIGVLVSKKWNTPVAHAEPAAAACPTPAAPAFVPALALEIEPLPEPAPIKRTPPVHAARRHKSAQVVDPEVPRLLSRP